MKKVWLCVMMALAINVQAAPLSIDSDSQKSLTLTLYNQDLGLIRDVRQVPRINKGQTLYIKGISHQLMSETLQIENAGQIIEQNLNRNLISTEALLQAHIGRSLTVARLNPATGQESRFEATLLSKTGNQVVIQRENQIETIPADNGNWRFIFPSIPQGMLSKPSLEVRSSGTKAASDAVLTYLSHGLSWQMDYAIMLDKSGKQLSLNGLATLTNRSGVDYPDSKILLMAGQVNQLTAAPLHKQRAVMMAMSDAAVAESGQPQSFQDYQLYKLPRSTSLLNDQTKQVSLISADGVSSDKEYLYSFPVYAGPDRAMYEDKPNILLKFQNQQQDGLGFPLPAGNARVFSPDDDGNNHFIGSAPLRHSTLGQTISLPIGKAFDLSIKRHQSEFKKSYDSHLVGQTLTLRNNKTQPVTIKVNVDFNQPWKIEESSHPTLQINASRAQWQISIPANDEINLDFQVKLSKP